MYLLEVFDQKIKKLKSHTANLLTLANLSLGGFSIITTIKGELNLSLLLIFIAALLDRFDGITARRLNIESELGEQLDSMSDIISFGVAPALLMFQSILAEFDAPGAFVTVLYIACGAFRLARFNISQKNGYFRGLPITAAGCILTFSFLALPYVPAHFFLYLTMVLSVLMISTFRLKKI